MKKNTIKIILDVILAAVMILMYNAKVLTLSFHEIGGLILIGAFLIHICLSPKWIVSTTKKLFSKSLPARTRLLYIIDFLLLVCAAVIAVSGIMISKVVFRGAEDRAMQAWHYFAAALALALAGIHIGLHWEFIKGMFGKVTRLPKMLGRVLGVILIAAILAYGGYSLAVSGFAGWMTAPFTASLSGGRGPGGGHFRQYQGGIGSIEDFGQFTTQEGQTADGDAPQFQGKGSRNGAGPQLREGSGKRNWPGFHSRERSGSVTGVIAAFGSIAGMFAIVTAFIAKLLKRKKPAAAGSKEITPLASPTE